MQAPQDLYLSSHILYQKPGVRINDSWYFFCKATGEYHAYFLTYPKDGDPAGMWDWQSIGHAVSRDLRTWEYLGDMLSPKAGTLCDVGYATGSVAEYAGKYYMVCTGKSAGGYGIALAISDDLYHWEVAPEFIVPGKKYELENAGGAETVQPLADPYLYPEPVNGRYYMFINSYNHSSPINRRGCLLAFSTADFSSWRPEGIAVRYPCDRMETPQVWEHGGKWYLYFGAAYEAGAELPPYRNTVLTADSFFGEYQPRGDFMIPGDFYIGKQIGTPCGKEYFLVNKMPDYAAGPYEIEYPEEGGIRLKAE